MYAGPTARYGTPGIAVGLAFIGGVGTPVGTLGGLGTPGAVGGTIVLEPEPVICAFGPQADKRATKPNRANADSFFMMYLRVVDSFPRGTAGW